MYTSRAIFLHATALLALLSESCIAVSLVCTWESQTQLKQSHSVDFDGILSPQEIHLKLLADQFPTGELENWDTCQQLLPCAIDVYNTEARSKHGQTSLRTSHGTFASAIVYMLRTL